MTGYIAGELAVEIHDDSRSMGVAAARDAAAAIRAAVADHGSARMIIATGNSQFDFTDALLGEDAPWDLVTVFHMDEYIGIDGTHSASFQRWIRERIADRLHPGHVEYIHGDADPAAEIARYEALLRSAPIDLTCMGIGENGHLAFNEPGDTDFDDERWVRVIALTDESQAQQVGEGHFPDLAHVPANAISLTIPALLSAARVQVCVPEQRKARAVADALTGPVGTDCPASILQRASQATLYLDAAAASDLNLAELAPR